MKLFVLAALCLCLAAARLEQPRSAQRLIRSEENSNSNSNERKSDEKSTSTENSSEEEKFYENIRGRKDVTETIFRAGREYKYLYNGQVLTGLPGSSVQHSGSRIQAIATLQFLTDSRVMMKLSNIRMGRTTADIPQPRQNLPFRVFDEIQIQSKMENKLEKPVEFSYTNGLIHDLVLEQGELPWSVNIKRAVLNMLQVNMKEKNRVETEEHQILNQLRQDSSEVTPRRSRYFRVHERSIEGECDTVYEIGKRPTEEDSNVQVLNVTKSIDFETCTKRPQIKYNWRFQDECPTCEPKYADEDEVVKSSTVVKFNITGTRDSFMIESAEGESQYTFVPMTEEANVVNTYVKKWLQIISAGPIVARFAQLSQPFPSDSDMIYSLDWDEWKEKFFMEGETTFQQKTPYAQIPRKVEIVRDLLKKLTSSVSEKIEQDATHHFTRLVTVLRMATRAEIEEIHQQMFEGQSEHFTSEEQHKIKEFLVSGMALAGTRDSISHLVKKIRTRQVSTITATLALRELMNVRTVSTAMISEVKSLCKEPSVEESFPLRQSCWLAVGSMLNALCDENNKDQLAVEQTMTGEQLCPTVFKTQMVQELFSELKRRDSWEDQMIMIKTISNAGLDLGVFELEKIIYNADRRHPTFLRVEAIMALKNLRDDMPRKIRKMLMPIYMNPREFPELRITALYELINTFPDRSILELIAKNINAEPSRQVASFAYSYLNSLANSTNPCYKNMTGDLKLALRFTKPVTPGIQYSKMVHLPFYSEAIASGLDLNLGHVMSNLSLIPSHMSATLDTNFLGSWNRNLFTMGLGSEGLEPILSKMLNREMIQSGFEQLFDRSPRHIDSLPYARELREIFSSLKIKSRDYQTKEPKAWGYLKFKGQEVGFAPITKSLMTELLATSGTKMQQIEQKLRQGLPVNFHRATILQESTLKFPTSLGLPIVYTHKLPAIVGATGKIQLERNADGIALNFDVKPTFAISSTHSIEIWSPIVNSGLKIRSAIRGFAPLKGKVALNMRNYEVKMAFEPIKSTKEILVVESKPISFVQVWPKSIKIWEEAEEKTIMGEEFDRVITYDRSYGKKFLGVELKVKGRVNSQPFYKLAGTPSWPFSGPNKVSLTLSPASNAPEEIIVKLSGKLNKPIEERSSAELRDYHFKDQSASSSSSESDETTAERKPKANSQSNSDESISFEQSGEQIRKTKKTGEKSSESTEAFSQVNVDHLRQNELTVELTSRGPVKRQASFSLVHKYSIGLRYNKVSARFQRSPIPGDEKPWTFCFNTEMVYPKKPTDVAEAKLKKIVGKAQLKWGETCQSDKHITMILQAERSNTQEQTEKNMETIDECRYYEQKGIKSPVSCYSKLAKTAELMKYKVELDYENVPAELRNVSDSLFRFLKYEYFWHTEVASALVNNPKNKVVAKLTIDPESLQRVNITIKTPRENVTMRFIPVAIRLAPLNTHRSIVSTYLNDLTNGKYEPTCKVNDVRIRTFDGGRYEVPISTCYSVLAKDCSAENTFAVLMKKLSEGTEQKKVKIVTPRHKIVLTAGSRAGDIKVEVNDVEYNVQTGGAIQENGEIVAIIEEEGSYIKVNLMHARVKVYFDGYAAHIKASPVYMHRQCGLCGHFDSESRMESELLSPNFQHNSDVRQFYLDYIVTDGTCQPPKHESVCKDSRCQYQADWNTADEYSDDVYHRSPERREREVKPVLTTDVVEQLSRTCFSLNPQAQCPEGSYPVDYKISKAVEYRCLKNSDPRVIDLMNHSETKSVSKYLANISDSITRKVRQPTSCRRF